MNNGGQKAVFEGGTMVLRRRLVLGAVLSVVFIGAKSADGDPTARLRAARSLRCEYTSVVNTWVRSGRRTIEQVNDRGGAVYDNIDVAKGTARIIANTGASNLKVWVDTIWHSLWMLERAPSGNVIVTTVFPRYADGTDDFVVLEARHSMVGQIILGEESFGTCKVLE